MDLGLEGKTALVTGATSGIGEAIAKALAQEGVRVAIGGRNMDAAQRVVAEIGVSNAAVTALGDLSSDEGAQAAAESALGKLGQVDILINNAGIYGIYDYADLKPQVWAEVYNANVLSMVRLAHRLVPAMSARGWGRSVQIGSIAGMMPMPESAHYAAAKAAVLAFSVSLAKTLKGTSVTSNTVTCGMVMTPAFRRLVEDDALQQGTSFAAAERRIATTLVPTLSERLARPSEVASLVTYLCSARADYITGANILIDGGSVPTT